MERLEGRLHGAPNRQFLSGRRAGGEAFSVEWWWWIVKRAEETPVLKSLQSTPGVQVRKTHLRRISTAWLFFRRLLPLRGF
jgi:hypothetical protein